MIDIRTLAETARRHGILLIVDNTFLSPYFQKPLTLGADIVLHSGTKFLGGHNDTLAGFLVTSSSEVSEQLRFINPENRYAWKVRRQFEGCYVKKGMRMERINHSAQQIAEWLEQRENITFVSYPGLISDPGHELAKQQMKNGFGGVISFGVNADDKTVERFCAKLKVITFAVSLGHDESLIFPQPSYDERILLYPEKFRKGFIRFSVGLGSPEDIIGDLEQAFRTVGL